jgi:hypothetical protein
MMEIKNAVIESVTLEKGDRGFLQCWLQLSYGGTGQGFGGYVLYLPKSYSHHELKSLAGHFIFRCMEIAGVERWDQLQGRTIRVRSEHHKVHAIGHIVKDDWFDPSADFDPKPAKCDGNHGGPRCADPECWNDDKPGFFETINWITDETLPDADEPVLIEVKGYGVLPGSFDAAQWKWIDENGLPITRDQVIAWARMPVGSKDGV